MFVLEAVMASIVMMTGVVFVSSFDSYPIPQNVIARQLDVRVQDFLDVMQAETLRGSCGRTVLDQLLIDGIAGNHTLWKRKTNGWFGDGVMSSLSVRNGQGATLLHGYDGIIGSGRSATLMPEFDGAQVIATSPTDATNPSTLTLNALALRTGELLRLRGEAIETTIRLNDLTGAQTLWAAGVTGLLSNDTDDTPRRGVGTIAWSYDGLPELAYEFASQDFNDTLGFDLFLGALPVGGAPGQIPAGTILRVDLPPGWSPGELPGRGWVSDGPAGDLSRIQLRLTQNHAGDETLTIEAIAPVSVNRPFDVLHARLSNGSYGESSLVIQYPGEHSTELPRLAYPTIPYPLRADSNAFFGVAVANGGSNATVTNVTFAVPGGYDIWRHKGQGAHLFNEEWYTTNNRSPDGLGSWKIWDKNVSWSGKYELGSFSADWWGASIPISADAVNDSTSTQRAWGTGPVASFSFDNGVTLNSSQWGASPGILELRAPPDGEGEPGYPSSEGTFGVRVLGSQARLDARGSWSSTTVGSLTSLQSAVANASFRVSQRAVPLGTASYAVADLRSLVSTLAASGIQDSTVAVDLYTPPSVGCKPTQSWSTPSSAMPHEGIVALKFWDALGGASPQLYMIGDDGTVAKLDVLGKAPLWQVKLQGKLTSLDFSRSNPALPALLVGDSGGFVHRLREADGAEDWRVCVSTDCLVGSLVPKVGQSVVSISSRDDIGRFAASSADGAISLLDASTGSVVWSHDISTDPAHAEFGNFSSLHLRADNSVLATENPTREGLIRRLVRVIDEEIYTVEPLSDGFAQRDAVVFSASGMELRKLDATTLSELDSHSFDSPIAQVAAGDLNGNGLADGVVALDDLRVFVLTDSGSVIELHPDLTQTNKRLTGQPTGPAGTMCAASDLQVGPDPFAVVPPCTSAYVFGALPRTIGTSPISLTVAEQGVAYVYMMNIPHLCWMTLSTSACRALSVSGFPDTVAVGPWGSLVPPSSIMVGYDDGLLEARSQATADVLDSQKLSDFVGTFTVWYNLPGGGFFGSHILVAHLHWTDLQGKPQEVQLVDWFEAVDAKGEPATNPAYRVSLLVNDVTMMGDGTR